MGGCQNYGPYFGTLNIRCRTIIGTPKREHNLDSHPHDFEWRCGLAGKLRTWSLGLLRGTLEPPPQRYSRNSRASPCLYCESGTWTKKVGKIAQTPFKIA